MPGPQFVTDFEPRYGDMVDVSPRLRRLVCENPSTFTFHGTGTYVIGRGDVAVVDPGPRDDAHVEALLQALDGERVRHILITHTHGDHSPAAAALADATGAPVLGFGPHPTAAVGEGDDRDSDDGDDSDQDASGEGTTHREPSIEETPEFQAKHAPDVDFEPETRLSHGDVIDGPGYTIEALHTPGHISNHLCFALAEEHALLTGDHVMGWSTTIIPPPDGDIGAYLESLQLLLDRPDDRILYPTHGAPVTDPHPFVRALFDHRLMREQAIIGQLTAGPRSAREIVAVLYAGVRKELHKPAARSVLAHLRKLHDEGRVVTAVADASTLSSKTVWAHS